MPAQASEIDVLIQAYVQQNLDDEAMESSPSTAGKRRRRDRAGQVRPLPPDALDPAVGMSMTPKPHRVAGSSRYACRWCVVVCGGVWWCVVVCGGGE
jgi:hypothetical protein